MAWESLETCSCIMQYVLLLEVFGVLGRGVFRKISMPNAVYVAIKGVWGPRHGNLWNLFHAEFGTGMVEVWCRYGVGTVKVWCGYGVGQGTLQVWCWYPGIVTRYGESMVKVWRRYGQGMVHVRSRYGACMVRYGAGKVKVGCSYGVGMVKVEGMGQVFHLPSMCSRLFCVDISGAFTSNASRCISGLLIISVGRATRNDLSINIVDAAGCKAM